MAWRKLDICFLGFIPCFFLIFSERKIINLFGFELSPKFKLVGLIYTFPLSMLGWIPFRCDSLGETLKMFSIIFTPNRYLFLGLRENTYLIALLMVILFWVGYYYQNFLKPRLTNKYLFKDIIVTIEYSLLIIIIFIFLRPINQFIYFQF